MDDTPSNENGPPSAQKDPIAPIGKSYLKFLNTRLGRLNYFVGGLFVGALFFFFGMGLVLFGAAYRATPSDITSLAKHPLVIGIYLLLNLPLIVRRLHDLNRSGWWTVLICALGFIPLVNSAVALWLLFKKGTPNPNKYGPPPRGKVSIKEIFGLSN